MRLLVVGEERVDAGKTTFSVGLLAALDRGGRDPVGFKPRAGNDYWFDHDDVRAALAEGRLYGKDVARLAGASVPSPADEAVEAAGSSAPAPEDLNPVHRLWRPTPGRSGLLGERGRTFLVDRAGPIADPSFVVNGEAEAAGLLPERVAASLPLDGATRVDSVRALNEVTTERYLPAFERVTERVRATETAVVESYGDIAMPVSDLEFDAVAAVAPGRVRVFDGERFGRAREVASGSAREGQLEERVGAVAEMLDPVATVGLPALTGAERGDPAAVADAYDAAIAALLDTAGVQ